MDSIDDGRSHDVDMHEPYVPGLPLSKGLGMGHSLKAHAGTGTDAIIVRVWFAHVCPLRVGKKE